MNFDKALEISQSGANDYLNVVFDEQSYFVDPDTRLFTVPKLENALPSQMPLECPACDGMGASGAVAEQGAIAAAGTSFVTSMLVGVSLNLVYSLINMI